MPLLARLLQAAHVVGQAGKPLEATFVIEQSVDARQVPAQRAGQMAMQVGVDVAAAGAHHQAFQGRQAHAGVTALAVDHGAGRAAVAEMGHQPAAVVIGQAGHFGRALAHVAVAGAVETIAADTLFAVQRFGQGIAERMLWQALVKGRVEDGHLRQVGKHRQGRLDALQVGRVVQRREHGGVADGLQHRGIDAAGAGELLATVHHTMTDTVQGTSRGLLNQRQQMGECCPMVGA